MTGAHGGPEGAPEPHGATDDHPWRAAALATLRRAVDVRRGEVAALWMASAYFFFALASWFVLRPMRDAVAAASGVTQLSWLFAGTLTVTLVANPILSALVVRFPPRRFIPYAYHGVAAGLLVFYALFRTMGAVEGSVAEVWIGRAFFIGISVCVLFITTLFWSFMADVFGNDQGKRLFGFIGVGGTLGSVGGSALTAFLAPRIGAVNLLLVSIVLLELAVLTVARFPSVRAASPADPAGLRPGARTARGDDADSVGGSVWSGFTHTVRSPYLLGMAVFVILMTSGAAFLYFHQSAIVGESFADRTSRTEVLAKLELAAQVTTVVAQMFITGRVMRWFGLVTALAFLPMLSILGFGALAAQPTFLALAAFVVLRRAGNFAFTNPALGVAYTVVPRDDKYKAKAFIETFVYRAGDQMGAWMYAALTAAGLGLTGVAWVAVPLSAVWLALSIWLARRQAAMAADLDAGLPAAASRAATIA